eukprot:7965735-Pyramimonas_sp.AAC.1
MLEIETDLPTRFNRSDYTALTIDRIFISLPLAPRQLTINAKVACDATLLSGDRLSGRATISLSIGIKPRTPLIDQAIHPSIFRDPNYSVYFQQLLNAAKTDR